MTKSNWQQAIFDLMANKYVELHVTGEMGAVDAVLLMQGASTMLTVAEVIGAEDFDSAMTELMGKVK